MSNHKYTDVQIQFICKLRENHNTWKFIAEEFNEVFKPEIEVTPKKLRTIYGYYKISADIGHEEVDLKLLKHNRAVRVTNYKLRKEANTALDALNVREDIITELRKTLSSWKFPKTVVKSTKTTKKGKKAVLELLLSDLHIGKKTETYNFDVARRRLVELRDVFLYELEQAETKYQIDMIVIAMLGDIIESFEMHGLQSAVTAEAVTPVQVVKAVEIIFIEILRPIAQQGHKIVIPAVCGNHDRVLKDKPMNQPGQESITWIIYNMLAILCETTGLHNIEFIIPNRSWCIIDILGHKVLYEHADKSMRLERKSVNDKIAARQTQSGVIISFFRFGHFHEFVQFGRGKAICNGTPVTDDGFSLELGFDSDAGQAISLFVESSKRPNPFYWSYLVSLSQIR